MNHIDAVKSHLTERYLLGELMPAERDAFEEHYFGCTECAADLKAGAVFIDNARSVFSDQQTAPQRIEPERKSRRWTLFLRPAFLVPVLSCAMVLIVYQNLVVIPGLKHSGESSSAQVLQTFSLIEANSRGIGGQAFATSPGKPFSLYFDIPPTPNVTSFRCDVQTAAGEEKLSVSVSSAQAQDTVQLLVPGSVLAPGDYVLVIRAEAPVASNGNEVVRYRFSLR